MFLREIKLYKFFYFSNIFMVYCFFCSREERVMSCVKLKNSESVLICDDCIFKFYDELEKIKLVKDNSLIWFKMEEFSSNKKGLMNEIKNTKEFLLRKKI